MLYLEVESEGVMEWQKLDTESGAPLWFLEMPHVSNISFGVLINVGSRDEKWPEEAGLAHTVEHMLFEGSAHCNLRTQKDVAIYIEEVGGAMNACTSEEEILYFHQITSDEIERSLCVLGESLYHPAFPKEMIKAQLNVVLHEVLEDNDDPNKFLADAWTKRVFAKHPLCQIPCGLVNSIKNFRREDFFRFRNTFFHPVNFTYLAVGRGKPEKLLGLVNKYFPPTNGRVNQREKWNRPPLPAKTAILRKNIESAYVYSGAFLGSAQTKETAALRIFTSMLSLGMSSPFYEEIREKKGYCYWSDASVSDYSDISAFVISMTTKPETWKAALDLAYEIIHREKTGVQLLERTKKMIAGRLDLVDSTMAILEGGAHHLTRFGSPKSFEEIKKICDELTINDVQKAADLYLDPKKFFTAVLLPK